MESREERKRKSTDRGSDGDSSDEEQEIEEEEPVPPVQHQPGQGMHYGLLETPMCPLMFLELTSGGRV